MFQAFHKSRFFLLLFVLFYSVQGYSADEIAFTLVGSVRTSGDVTQVKVRLLDADGVMLDVSSPDSSGNFKIDLGAMDNPVYSEVEKLYLQLERGANKKKVRIKEYIREMSRTVTLRTISVP